MTKNGGGTSAYFGKLRPRGSEISNGRGTSMGAVHFMKLYDTTVSVISQGKVRRGAFAAYLDADHGDFEEFLTLRDHGHAIQDLSFGGCFSDDWMESMIKGDKKKREIQAKVIAKRRSSGFPYIFYSGNANKHKPQVYKDKNMEIVASNLCVLGSDRAPSQHGLLTVKELAEIGGDLQLFDNEKIVYAEPMRLIEQGADVYKITLANGMSHTVTDYHKVKVRISKSGTATKTAMVACEDLKVGDLVAVQTNCGLFGKNHKPKEAFLLGLYQSDGTQDKQCVHIDIWENNFDLLEEIEAAHTYVYETYASSLARLNGKEVKNNKFNDCNVCPSVTGRIVPKKRLSSTLLKRALNFEKGYIPQWIWEADEKTQWQYIRGLYICDGTANVCENAKGSPLHLSICNINKDFLKELQLLLVNLGVPSSLYLMREAGESLLPDGKGGYKPYNTKDAWRLVSGSKERALIFNEKTGFLDRKNVKIEQKEYRDNTKKFYKITSIDYAGKEDVYCTKVNSDEHLWICNGFVTSNCSEVMLPSTADESFVCCLSSMNLARYDYWKDTDAVELMIYFLDAVMTDFIQKTEGDPQMLAAHNFAKRHRALGLGGLGWHTYLQENMIPFESMQAKFKNAEIWKNIKENAEKASRNLAALFGEPELMQGYGMRNTTLLAVAPTVSSSFMLGQVSPSIEPLRNNAFEKDLAKGKFSYMNPTLKKLLAEKGKDTIEVWKDISKKDGSVQHLDFLSDLEKEVFKTFPEISQKEVIIQAAQRQKWICQGQSLNLCIGNTVSAKEINELLIFAWEMGIKSLYYHRGVNPMAATAQSLMECKSCAA